MTPIKRTTSGFTLVNLLTTLAIVAILVSAGTPSLLSFLANNQANNTYRKLFGLIQYARLESVNYGSQVILCPTVDRRECSQDWRQELMIFVDSNNDEGRDNEELLLRLTAKLTEENEYIYWKASGSRRYLRFKPTGETRNQNGRLTYCLHKGEKVYARQIIMYLTGRARRATEREALEQC